MRLDRMRMRQKKEYSLADAVAGTVFLSVVTLLCFYSAVWMAQDIFPDWKLTKTACAWIHALLIGTVCLYRVGIAAIPFWVLRLLCQISVPAVYGIVGFLYAKPRRIGLEDGACALATQFLVKFNNHLKTSFWIWKGKTELIGFSFAFWTLFIVLGLLLLTLLLQKRMLLLLLPVFVFAAELMVGYIPGWRGMAVCFAALLLMYADGESGKQQVLRVPMDQRHGSGSHWYIRYLPTVLLAAVVCAVFACSQSLSEATTGWLMAKALRIQAFQRNMERSVTGMWRGYFSPRSETVSNARPYYTGREMLFVTASKRPSRDLLLRGFCGTDYENGSWVCRTQPFSDACAQAGYSEEEAAGELFGRQHRIYMQQVDKTVLKYRFGEEFYAVYGGTNEQIDYTVSHTGVHSTYAFAPYGVSFEEGSRALESGQLIADTQIQKKRGQEEFSCSGWDYAAGMIEAGQVLQVQETGMFQWYDAFVKKTYLKTSGRVPSVYEYLESAMRDYVPSMDEYIEFWASSHYMGDGVEGEVSAASAYEARMQRNRETLLNLQQELSEISHPAWCNIDRLQIALALSGALQKYQTYSMDLETLAEGEDPVACFLMRTRKGYCMHFASAAVLFLRELGVPARFVAGYVARPADFQSSGGSYTAVVRDRNAHAWAEIYLDRIGWVPIDVTPPAARDAAYAADADAGAQYPDHTADPGTGHTPLNKEETQPDNEDTGTGSEEEKEEKENNTDKDTGKKRTATGSEEDKPGLIARLILKRGGREGGMYRLWKKYHRVAAVFGTLLLLGCCLLLCRRLLYLWRTVPQREIKAGRCSKAVRTINRRIYRRLCIRRKCTRLSVSDTQYEQFLKAAYQQVAAADWTRYMQAVRQAAYGQDEVEKEDACFCFRVYKAVGTVP